jgi:uracil-DNA glycosylase family 4
VGRDPLLQLNARIVGCRVCARLVAHREAVAAAPPRRHRGQTYWARPLTGFGDPGARVLLVGLAPAAHGGNRTGRMFTGDQSGNWLFRALHEAGFASQPTSEHREDGLRLRDAYITAAARCAPPANKLTPAELAACRPYLLDELRHLARVRVVIGLGRIGWTAYLQARRELGAPPALRPPVFGHNVPTRFADGCVLLGCYHPSQQNTFTGRLTRSMLRRVFATARRLLEEPVRGARSGSGGEQPAGMDRPMSISRRGPREGAGARRP